MKSYSLLIFILLVATILITECHEGHSHSHKGGGGHSHGHSHKGGGHAHGHTNKKEEKVDKAAEINKKLNNVYIYFSGIWSHIEELFSPLFPYLNNLNHYFEEFSKWLATTLQKYQFKDPKHSALAATAFIGFVPIVVIIFVPIGGNIHGLKTLLSFAVGGLLGDVFLHLLPHSGGHDHEHGSVDSIGLLVLAGMFTFFILEKIATLRGRTHHHDHDGEKHDHHHHETEDRLRVSSILNVIADWAHNMTDGMAIAASFLNSFNLGISTTLAVFFHEIPHEIGDLAILVSAGWSKKQVIFIQIFTALGSILGAFIGFGADMLPFKSDWILPFTAGGFIYIATVSIIPQLFDKTTLWQTIKESFAMALGVLMMIGISLIEQH